MFLDIDHRLTRDPTSDRAAATHAGQAHFAGTGPQGRTCRECKFWITVSAGVSHAYYAGAARHGRTLKPHPCKLFRKFTGKPGTPVPYNAGACKYFEPSDNPPPIYPKRR